MMQNPWNELVDIFGRNGSLEHVPAEAADNMLIAWPVILDFIREHDTSSAGKKALDYGCGGGSFAAKLHQMGYTSFGVDTSRELTSRARNHYSEYATFIRGNEFIAKQHGPFDLITSLMTFEFISNIEQVLPTLVSSLTKNGLFVFATHNPEYVLESAKSIGSPYSGFKAGQHSGTLNFGSVAVPMTIRSAEQYRAILKPLGFEPLLEAYPPFTPQFLATYPIEGPVNYSEYLIMGFRKK